MFGSRGYGLGLGFRVGEVKIRCFGLGVMVKYIFYRGYVLDWGGWALMRFFFFEEVVLRG